MSEFPRGSEWRQWDLHIHSPASFEWNGAKFLNGGHGDHDESLIDQMIEAINMARPAVFAIMDYWSFDGWFALKHRLKQEGAPQLKKTVFPGIELRLCAPMPGRLNAHVLFSDKISDQQLKNFLGTLKLALTDEPLSKEGLQNYARQLGEDKLLRHSFNNKNIAADADLALEAGYKTAEVTAESYKAAIERVPEEMAVGFMPISTNDGLEKVKLMDHYAYVMSLFRSSPIFETRDEGNWNAFVGRRIAANASYFDAFFKAMQEVPRLPVSGSDAHCFTGNGTNEKRGYGDYPSGKITWIKADPTWRGLLQAIKEPQNRCFIGEIPPKLEKVNNFKPFYIDSISLNSVPEYNSPEIWFDGCNIKLNTDLVAVIGNRGSGKSALADAIALLGRSQEKEHYSFLKKDRFRGKSGDPARKFTGRLDWMAGEPCTANLAEDPLPEQVELVKYIPQGRFEALCNDHVTGSSNVFEKELRDVIFAHIPKEQRLETLNFDQLIERHEKIIRIKRSELRKDLRTLNEKIVSVEDQLHVALKGKLEEKLRLKALQLQELQAMKPKEVVAPTEQLTVHQQNVAKELETLVKHESAYEVRHKIFFKIKNKLAEKKQSIKTATEQIDFFETQCTKFCKEISTELKKVGLNITDVIEIIVKRDNLKKVEGTIAAAIERNNLKIEAIAAEREKIEKSKIAASATLNEPQKRYQEYLKSLHQWKLQVAVVEGDANSPDSKIGLETRIAQIDSLPETLNELKSKRINVLKEIYTTFYNQKMAREDMFKPVQELIASNTLIGEHYKLQFQSNLTFFPDTIAENVFSIIKQNIGEFRGDSESREAIKKLYDTILSQDNEGAITFIIDLVKKIEEAATLSDKGATGVRAILRKDKTPEDLYNYLFGLEFIEPQYTLLFQNTPIEQLSPGQRGALLLIFYLLVDKGSNPIILDQPEENLDNETIVSLLVPVVEEAKKNRQIIMVTHNPNLAVVCDAEQIIAANFNRSDGFQISYYTGSIEDKQSNKYVVDILEGTKRAFNNRKGKYF